MDSQRIINIILSDLTLENLKLQETLENTINSSEVIDIKVPKIKETLKLLAINDLAVAKFQTLISTPNNTQQNKTENG